MRTSSTLTQLKSLDIKYNWSKCFSIHELLSHTTTRDNDTDDHSQDKSCNTMPVTVPCKPPVTPLCNRKFSANRDKLTAKYFSEYNKAAFRNELPPDMTVSWSKRLTKTAGYTRFVKRSLSSSPREASIELSEKVIDNEERLRQTLAHEMCHAAAWLIDGVAKPAHGECFWKWARRAERQIPGITVTRCHSYEIHTPHKFQCTNESCGKIYSRHSKKGVDPTRHVCGICRSRLVYSGAFNANGTPKKQREASGFSLFVKENYASIKKAKELVQHKDVMSELSSLYAAQRIATDD